MALFRVSACAGESHGQSKWPTVLMYACIGFMILRYPFWIAQVYEICPLQDNICDEFGNSQHQFMNRTKLFQH